MKIIDKLIRVGLVAMILLSLFLSWKIWSNSDNKQLTKQQSDTTKNTAMLKQPADIFLPVSLIYHNNKGEHLYSNKESLLQNLSRQILDQSSGGLLGNGEEVALIAKKDTFELTMSDDLSLSYFLEINNKTMPDDLKRTTNFRRMVVSMKDKRLYFVNSDYKEVFQMSLKSDPTAFTKILDEGSNRFLDVAEMGADHGLYYNFAEEIKLPKYSYILATQSYSVFSKAFFETTSNLTSNNDDVNASDIRLANAAGDTMKVVFESGEVTFNGRLASQKKDDKQGTTFFEESFASLQNIGNSLGTLRYYEGNEQKITYRNYVEGYPVFGESAKGRVVFSKQQPDKVEIKLNQEAIQVPIPSTEKVTLPPTQSVIDTLAYYGIETSTIKGIQIGYTWLGNQETKQVVDLTPEWYVKLDNKWQSLSEIEEKLNKEVLANGF